MNLKDIEMNCNYKILEIRNKKYIIWTSGIINDRVFVHINGATEDNINDYISVVLDNLGIITMNGPHTLFEDGLSYIQDHRDDYTRWRQLLSPALKYFMRRVWVKPNL